VPKVVHFEIPADNPERAVKFYKKVFNWKIEKWAGPMDYWLVTAGEEKEPGINGAITPKANLTVTTNTINVPSVDDFIEKIKEAGGKVVQGKMAVQGVGYMAYCMDTEGNVFGIMQMDKSAK
jgi:predicted enzyme related to lactoylglutathione lyase